MEQHINDPTKYEVNYTDMYTTGWCTAHFQPCRTAVSRCHRENPRTPRRKGSYIKCRMLDLDLSLEEYRILTF